MSDEHYCEKGFISGQYEFVALHLFNELPYLYIISYAPGHSSHIHHYGLGLSATALLLPVSLPAAETPSDEGCSEDFITVSQIFIIFSFIHRWTAGASAIAA